MSARERLLQEIEQAPDSLVEELLDFLLSTKIRQFQDAIQLERAPEKEVGTSILELLEKFPLPDSEATQLPTDLAAQHDHYLYGLPKRD